MNCLQQNCCPTPCRYSNLSFLDTAEYSYVGAEKFLYWIIWKPRSFPNWAPVISSICHINQLKDELRKAKICISYMMCSTTSARIRQSIQLKPHEYLWSKFLKCVERLKALPCTSENKEVALDSDQWWPFQVCHSVTPFQRKSLLLRISFRGDYEENRKVLAKKNPSKG